MVGKKNIVFGFLYLVLTAALGPYMVISQLPDVQQAAQVKQKDVGRLQALASNDFEEDLEPLTADQLARANTMGILALNRQGNAQAPVDQIKGGPHAHGNLEAMLNIAAGLVLCFIALPVLWKQVISWLFIAGALFHSGSLYLLNFGMVWASMTLNLGPWLVLLALLSIGLAAAIGFRAELVQDD